MTKDQSTTTSYTKLKIGELEVLIYDEKDTGLRKVNDLAIASMKTLVNLAKENNKTGIR
jgi:hypothetical protein